MASSYVGRFAPTPSGALHAGSLVAALASWLDARAHGGQGLVRIEDLDRPRNVAGAREAILAQLDRCQLRPDGEVSLQSNHTARYEAALQRLVAGGAAYPCACSRRDLDDGVYPGTCRLGLGGRPARSWRLRTGAGTVAWTDRRLGPQQQDVAAEVGDFVLRRADGIWAYQLAVVVDDAAQGVTDVVRGADLADNTARQVVLQRCLDLPSPRTLHVPLVLGADGAKLSKQNGATAVDLGVPLAALREAGTVLGLHADSTGVARWLEQAVVQWRQQFVR
ncbi:MAG: tRNA glutamyl-Q(34) synthetase GluQRS [Caldimonas sp.]